MDQLRTRFAPRNKVRRSVYVYYYKTLDVAFRNQPTRILHNGCKRQKGLLNGKR